MPRWKTPRWTLGAPALVALAVAGCGAAASQPKLHNTAEKRLLSLVANARVDATNHDGTAVRAVLGEFVSNIRTLRASGQLSGATAGRLGREARAAAAQAARQLHPKLAVRAGTATTPAQSLDPVTSSTPATAEGPPARRHARAPANGAPAGPGQGHGRGHGYGHHGWSRVAGGANTAGTQAATNAWAQWWKDVTGGGGD